MASFFDGISEFTNKNPQLVAQGLNALGSMLALNRRSPDPNYHGNIYRQGLANAGSMFLQNAQAQALRGDKEKTAAENLRRFKLERGDKATALAREADWRTEDQTIASDRFGTTQTGLADRAAARQEGLKSRFLKAEAGRDARFTEGQLAQGGRTREAIEGRLEVAKIRAGKAPTPTTVEKLHKYRNTLAPGTSEHNEVSAIITKAGAVVGRTPFDVKASPPPAAAGRALPTTPTGEAANPKSAFGWEGRIGALGNTILENIGVGSYDAKSKSARDFNRTLKAGLISGAANADRAQDRDSKYSRQAIESLVPAATGFGDTKETARSQYHAVNNWLSTRISELEGVRGAGSLTPAHRSKLELGLNSLKSLQMTVQKVLGAWDDEDIVKDGGGVSDAEIEEMEKRLDPDG